LPRPWGVAALLAAFLPWPQNSKRTGRFALSGWIIVSCLVFQQLFIQDTLNEAENGLPWFGLICGLALGFAAELLESKGRLILHSGSEQLDLSFSMIRTRKIVLAVSVLLWSALMLVGTRTSWKRYVQQFKKDTRFDQILNVPGLRRLKWADVSYAERFGNSTGSSPQTSDPLPMLRKADLEGVNDWLDLNPRTSLYSGLLPFCTDCTGKCLHNRGSIFSTTIATLTAICRWLTRS
jgi:hypothetical protein